MKKQVYCVVVWSLRDQDDEFVCVRQKVGWVESGLGQGLSRPKAYLRLWSYSNKKAFANI